MLPENSLMSVHFRVPVKKLEDRGLGSNGTENSVKDYSSPSRFLNGRSSPRFIASGTAKE